MKIVKNLFSSFSPAQVNNPQKVKMAKLRLAKLTPEQLHNELNKESKKVNDVLGRMGLRKEVPTVIQAMSELHRGATYFRHEMGNPNKRTGIDYQTIYVDKWRDAMALANKRYRVLKFDLPALPKPTQQKAVQPKQPAVASKPQAQKAAPKKVRIDLPEKMVQFAVPPQRIKFEDLRPSAADLRILEWRKNVLSGDQMINAKVNDTFALIDRLRTEHPSQPMIKGGAKMTELQLMRAAQETYGEAYVNAWAGLTSRPATLSRSG